MEATSNPRSEIAKFDGEVDEEESESDKRSIDDTHEVLSRGEAAATGACLIRRYAPECVRHEFHHLDEVHKAALAILTATDPTAAERLRPQVIRDPTTEPTNTTERQLLRVRRELRRDSQ